MQAWLDAPDAASRKPMASELATLAMTEVSTIPLGQFFDKTAYRRSITGIPEGVSPYPWSVRPA
jgi:peptide/nickel transport system substrate-binding protein